LTNLAVGDAVTFNTTTSGSTPTIDKLHAGNDSLDWPSGPPPAGANGAMPQAPSGSPAAPGSGPVA
jgi:hypothetical protein